MLRKLVSGFALGGLVLSTAAAFAADPFQQGDRVLNKASEAKRPLLLRVHPKTGETTLFNAKDVDASKLSSIAKADDKAKEDFMRDAITKAEQNEVKGGLQVMEKDKSTPAYYGYYYGYYYTPVYYTYYPTTIYYYSYSYTYTTYYYYSGYRYYWYY